MKNIFRRFGKNQKEDIKDTQSNPSQFKIGIIGVGCGGCNIINLMHDLKFHRDSLMVFIEYLKLHPESIKDKSTHFHFWKP